MLRKVEISWRSLERRGVRGVVGGDGGRDLEGDRGGVRRGYLRVWGERECDCSRSLLGLGLCYGVSWSM